MPNALILEYQKSRIEHTPSHLHTGLRATGIELTDCDEDTSSALLW